MTEPRFIDVTNADAVAYERIVNQEEAAKYNSRRHFAAVEEREAALEARRRELDRMVATGKIRLDRFGGVRQEF